MELQPKKAVTTPTAQVNPTALHKGFEKESLNAVNPEVVEFLLMISTCLTNTEASKAIKSKMDRTVLVEA